MTFNGTKLPLARLRSMGLMAMIGATGLLTSCLDRPVGQTKPETNNVFIKKNPSGGIDKIDILFDIDNSLSMGDKQSVLSAAVPQLLTRLTNPDCVSTDGTQRTAPPADPSTACPAPLQREFAPVKDIHIGIVTSSLGDYGGNACPEPGETSDQAFPDQNDHGWLLGALPRAAGILATPFLSWTGVDAQSYATSIGTKTTEFRNFVTTAGEIGCGIEQSMESWYRFLIDPYPPLDITAPGKGPVTRGVDPKNTATYSQDILAQRAQFLRSDSLVAVIMMTDENDCSLKDTGAYSWLLANSGSPGMWRGSSTCATNPNDPCCYSCMADFTKNQPIPAGCAAKDPTCTYAGGGGMTQSTDSTQPNYDNLNMRCRKNKQRFGYDFLFPVTRYANALTMKTICPDQTYGDLDCDCTAAKARGVDCQAGTPVPNPLYQNLSGALPTGPARTDPSVVFFGGILGVPWQDLATADSLPATAPLAYQLASQLDWDLFAPKDEFATPPKDPFMVESFDPRTGTHPITGDVLAPTTAGYMANKINGHEWNTGGNDQQFSCIFSLQQPIVAGTTTATRDCVQATYCANAADPAKCARAFAGCSCGTVGANYAQNSPTCQDAAGAYTTTQTYAKAYPTTRNLQALRAFMETSGTQDNTIAASICPKDLQAANTSSGYGYNPAVAALVARLKEKLGGTCLPRPLTVSADGTVPCAIVEVIQKTDATGAPTASAEWCDCAAKKRQPVPDGIKNAMGTALEREKVCGGTTKTACSSFCFCELPELTSGPAADQCANQLNVEKSAAAPGFCYVDPAQNTGTGAADIVSGCPTSQKQLIRIVGGPGGQGAVPSAPAPGLVFIACSGAPFGG